MFGCTDCGLQFTQKKSLYRHIRNTSCFKASGRPLQNQTLSIEEPILSIKEPILPMEPETPMDKRLKLETKLLAVRIQHESLRVRGELNALYMRYSQPAVKEKELQEKIDGLRILGDKLLLHKQMTLLEKEIDRERKISLICASDKSDGLNKFELYSKLKVLQPRKKRSTKTKT